MIICVHIPRRWRNHKFQTCILLVAIATIIYFLGDADFNGFKLHWLPEMAAFAVLGLAFAEWGYSYKIVAVFYVFPVFFGIWAVGWAGVPLSLLIEAPLVLAYLIAQKR